LKIKPAFIDSIGGDKYKWNLNINGKVYENINGVMILLKTSLPPAITM